MLHDDDVLVSRWQRWHRRVMAINRDVLLQWTLVSAAATMAISSVLMVLALLVSALASLWSLF